MITHYMKLVESLLSSSLNDKGKANAKKDILRLPRERIASAVFSSLDFNIEPYVTFCNGTMIGGSSISFDLLEGDSEISVLFSFQNRFC
jgi:hypothetical protein